jgi:MHS family proline/betaine transporter-like MFS transporter
MPRRAKQHIRTDSDRIQVSIVCPRSPWFPLPIYSLIIAWHSIALMFIAQLFFAVAIALFSGPGPAASVEIFDSSRRVFGVSIANSFASIIFGGFAPFIATWLILETSSLIAPFYYVMFTCLVSGIIIFKLPETAHKDLG